jgi:surface antigen
MLAQVKKLAGGDIAGRFGAWWSGRDYTPPEGGEEAAGADGKPADKPAAAATEKPAEKPVEKPAEIKPEPVVAEAPEEAAPAKAPNRNQVINGAAVRIRALETLWGEGRLAPGSFALDTRMIDATLELANGPGDIGFIGADGGLLSTFAGQSGRRALVSEWRSECVTRLAESAPNAVVTAGEVDRPRGFVDGSLPAILSIEAFAFADHKAGLVGRVVRALDDKGRWVFLDTTRRTKKTPPQAFASAWAEPQLATDQEIEELLQLAGFKTVRKVSANALVLQAARQGYAQLAQVLEDAASNGLTGREGALFLQELAWEAQSWRARTRAIEGGALDVNIWVADKTVQVGPLAISLDQVVGADDAGTSDALFDQS